SYFCTIFSSFTSKLVRSRALSVSSRSDSLSEFFDAPQNWGVVSVKSGRPWRIEELRRKSASDLHNLWYILLKERNMLMTMEEEHWRRLERMPNPERFEKVEESMENILKVVEERDRAICELERGEWVGPKEVEAVDQLGRPVTRLTEEHLEPQVAGRSSQAEDEKMWGAWTLRYLRREREKQLRAQREAARVQRFERLQAWRRRVMNISDEDTFERPQTTVAAKTT
ncbi:unnamed protein product, partial [Schistocephalus solidus]|uniref:Large ribosomal subunit protein uL29m n=3 Tax=Schistocephalus solidus TaxID=70667 RepID=A0A183TJ66_SCHSO